ncbi:Phosphoribosyl-ATP pyrophosphatase [Candidatus Hodgkinia cicadicola]|uniref:Phosphoribosyl-ATP pyrophosphatase n=1 Tax=Candidatus Hodgkinia cicadicola TaxID=573658 RepID=A0ABX4MFJ5_9HYPH|nr:Phosphoribosyl-ATP pyrophosphatase [Candidatus Hodgkinia cicadicola]
MIYTSRNRPNIYSCTSRNKYNSDTYYLPHISHTRIMDNFAINVRRKSWRSWCHWGLYELMVLVCIKSQIISDQNQLTTDLLTTRPRYIFKRIKEEQTELTFTINFQADREAIIESVDLIHQVFLLARSIGLNINNVIRLIDYRLIEALTQRYEKWPNLSRINKSKYTMGYRLSMNSFWSNNLDNITLGRLNYSISNLSMFITKFRPGDYRYCSILETLFFNILQNIIILIYNRDIKYSTTINEVINKLV